MSLHWITTQGARPARRAFFQSHVPNSGLLPNSGCYTGGLWEYQEGADDADSEGWSVKCSVGRTWRLPKSCRGEGRHRMPSPPGWTAQRAAAAATSWAPP